MSDAPSPSVRARVALVSLGCAKNLADSEGLVSSLQTAGFRLTERVDEADLALVNTCGFIEPAKQESIEAVLNVCRHKEFGRLRGVMVAGCLVERYLDDLRRDIPEVDRWLPFGDYERIVEAAESLMGLPQVRPLPPERVLLTGQAYAYLKVSEGCDQKCTFCAIPGIRGRLRSRPIEVNVEDARRIAALGVQEINVVSQDTTAYGRDLYGRPKLAELMRELTRIDGPAWWRILYLYPTVLRDDLLDEIAANDRIVKYVDIPLQHMSTPMLRAMRRGIDADRQRALLERIRARIPGVAIRTTLITGFPGETDADHEANRAAVRDGLFDRLGVFPFSREEGTPSFGMPDAVPEDVAQERRGELMALQQEVHFARNQARVGTTIDMLVEEVDPFSGSARGRSAMDAPDVDAEVRIQDARRVPGGRVVSVEVTGTDGYDLVGRPAE